MKVTYDMIGDVAREGCATVFVISDSLGESALNVVMSAASQFPEGAVRIVRLSQIVALECVSGFFDEHDGEYVPTAVFHSIVDPALRGAVRADLNARGITSVDILGPVVQVLSSLTGKRPKNLATAHHTVDSHYLRRVSAMEFCVAHDNGKNPQDLPKADVVLVGLTGAAKTPLAMHLSFLGLNVCSISLDMEDEVPAELFQVDPKRVFGLESTSDMLAQSRKRQLSAGTHLDFEPTLDLASIEQQQARANEIIGKLGCARLRIEGKTVEELAADVLSRIEARE